MLALAAVFVLAVGLFVRCANAQSSAPMLEVYQDGRLLRRISLMEETVFEVEGAYLNTISVQGGSAAIIQSNCPGEDCVRSGWTKGEKSIVCLPNRLELRPAQFAD